ncbi:MAG: hypothetical protein PF487_02210, partial [Bacteroidales bacterium]|nr:hypothetical protein [Bacteroidales bacterium]
SQRLLIIICRWYTFQLLYGIVYYYIQQQAQGTVEARLQSLSKHGCRACRSRVAELVEAKVLKIFFIGH